MDHGQPYFTIFYATVDGRDKLKLHETNEAIFRQKLNVFFIEDNSKKKINSRQFRNFKRKWGWPSKTRN